MNEKVKGRKTYGYWNEGTLHLKAVDLQDK